MANHSTLIGFSLAIGVGMLVHTILSILIETAIRLTRATRRSRLSVLGMNSNTPGKDLSGEKNFLNLDHLPWGSIYAGAALVGLFLLAGLGTHLPGIRVLFLTPPAAVWLVRRFLIRQRKRFLPAQIRQFWIDVRLHTSLQGSLLLGLENLARATRENSPICRSLKHRLSGGAAQSGLELLEMISTDLSYPPFTRTLQRVQAAQQSGGVCDIDQAIARVVEELNEEIHYQTEEQMQRLPTRITLLAMPFLLGPIVILVFYPLVDRILKTLSGVSVGGGF